MTQVSNAVLKNEATAVIAELIAGDQLNSALDDMIAGLKCVSTFSCLEDIPGFSAFLEKVKADHSLVKGREETLFCLHLLSLSDTRHEELNGTELTLTEVDKKFRDTLKRLFGVTMPKNAPLLEMASALNRNWEDLPPGKIRYEIIDGQTCQRLAGIFQKENHPDIINLWEELQRPVENAVTPEDILAVLKKVVGGLFAIPGTDFVLFSGPVKPLIPHQETTANDFFSYVFVSPRVSRGEEKSQRISEVFRSARKRYFSGGYHTLLPAYGDHEDCRKEHQPLQFKSFMRAPGMVEGQPNAIELRCASQDAGQYRENQLKLLLDYMCLGERIVEGAFTKGIVLAHQLEINDIILH